MDFCWTGSSTQMNRAARQTEWILFTLWLWEPFTLWRWESYDCVIGQENEKNVRVCLHCSAITVSNSRKLEQPECWGRSPWRALCSHRPIVWFMYLAKRGASALWVQAGQMFTLVDRGWGCEHISLHDHDPTPAVDTDLPSSTWVSLWTDAPPSSSGLSPLTSQSTYIYWRGRHSRKPQNHISRNNISKRDINKHFSRCIKIM